jgi:hypothetical protein
MFFFSSLEKDHSTSWSRWFHHLEWICYVEDARPFVWMALVHLITPPPPTAAAASTASTAATAATAATTTTLVDQYNFMHVHALLSKFVQPVMVDVYHRKTGQRQVKDRSTTANNATKTHSFIFEIFEIFEIFVVFFEPQDNVHAVCP